MRRADNLRARSLILVVGKGREFAGVRLHQHLVPGLRQRLHTRGSDADAALMVFHFLWNSDNHYRSLQANFPSYLTARFGAAAIDAHQSNSVPSSLRFIGR